MSAFPEPPASLPRLHARTNFRFEDVTQDGRVQLLAIATGFGPALWGTELQRHPISTIAIPSGVIPLITRLVIESSGGPVAVAPAIDLEGCYQLAHSRDVNGAVERLYLNNWVTLRAPRGRTHGPRPAGAGETIVVGRAHVENVFTRPFAPPSERKVLSFAGIPGLPEVPADTHHPIRTDSLLAAPRAPGAHALDEALVPDETEVVFGLAHTDSNQHVNSLIYPRVFEEALLRRLARHRIDTTRLARAVDVAFRKPSFAGERLRLRLQAFQLPAGYGAVGVFEAEGEPRPRVLCRMVVE